MPRISPRAFKTAHARHPHLAQLLPICRDLRSAENELRWIRERAQICTLDPFSHDTGTIVSQLVRRRSRGEPLQYVLGTEFFADLEILCKPGVLIPRPETAASVTHLVERLTAQLGKQQPPSQLRVLDFCTGTGCIPLLFHDEFYKSPNVSDVQLDITGYDISKNALSLAHENLAMQMDQPANRTLQNGKISARHESLRKIRFLRYDVLGQDIECTQTEAVAGNRGFQRSPSDSASARLSSSLPDKCDVLVSNPPYISPSDYMRTTARSVRHFEPKLALVPLSTAFAQHVDHENLGELFYPRLLDLAEELSAKVVLLEVADLEQASRVVKLLAQRPSWSVDVEIWRDEPSRHHEQNILSGGRSLRIIGEGSGRSVFIWRKDYCARRCLL